MKKVLFLVTVGMALLLSVGLAKAPTVSYDWGSIKIGDRICAGDSVEDEISIYNLPFTEVKADEKGKYMPPLPGLCLVYNSTCDCYRYDVSGMAPGSYEDFFGKRLVAAAESGNWREIEGMGRLQAPIADNVAIEALLRAAQAGQREAAEVVLRYHISQDALRAALMAAAVAGHTEIVGEMMRIEAISSDDVLRTAQEVLRRGGPRMVQMLELFKRSLGSKLLSELHPINYYEDYVSGAPVREWGAREEAAKERMQMMLQEARAKKRIEESRAFFGGVHLRSPIFPAGVSTEITSFLVEPGLVKQLVEEEGFRHGPAVREPAKEALIDEERAGRFGVQEIERQVRERMMRERAATARALRGEGQ